jgi:hypothetical protein
VDERIGRPLRHADREHTRQSPAGGIILVRVEEGVGQLSDPFFGHLAQRE